MGAVSLKNGHATNQHDQARIYVDKRDVLRHRNYTSFFAHDNAALHHHSRRQQSRRELLNIAI